jgi:hypothetical protein
MTDQICSVPDWQNNLDEHTELYLNTDILKKEIYWGERELLSSLLLLLFLVVVVVVVVVLLAPEPFFWTLATFSVPYSYTHSVTASVV